MKFRYFYPLIFIVLSFCVGCEKTKSSTDFTEDISQKEYENILSLGHNDSLDYWKKKLHKSQLRGEKGIEAYIYYHLATTFFKKDPKTSDLYFNKSINIIEHTNDYTYVKALIYKEKGERLIHEKKLFLAAHYINEAAALVSNHLTFLPINTKVDIYESALNINYKNKQLPQAINFAEAIISLQNKEKDQKNVSTLFRAYCRIFFSQLDTEYPTDSLQKTLRPIDSLKMLFHDPEAEIMYYNVHTDYSDKIHDYDSAIYYVKKAQKVNDQFINSRPDNPKNYHYKIDFHIQSKLMDLYAKVKKMDSAKYYYNTSKEIHQKHTNLINNFDKSLHYENLIRYFKNTKSPSNALAYSDSLILIKDSLFQNAVQNSSNELISLYKIQSQQQTIQNLNSELELNHVKLKNTQLIFITAFLGILILAVFLYFLQNRRKLKEELKLFLLEQQLLRAQMEPHFIFNAIAALQSYIRFDEKEKSLKYLHNFSRLLRGNLELSRHKLAPLSQELDILQNYISLQQIRLNYEFNCIFSIEDTIETEETHIPPMLIQPFIENAILHAFNEKKEDQTIEVSIKKSTNYLHVTIIDNGSGFNLLKLNTKAENQSLATSIARERLAMLVQQGHERSKLKISSIEGKGTKVLLIIPYYT